LSRRGAHQSQRPTRLCCCSSSGNKCEAVRHEQQHWGRAHWSVTRFFSFTWHRQHCAAAHTLKAVWSPRRHLGRVCQPKTGRRYTTACVPTQAHRVAALLKPRGMPQHPPQAQPIAQADTHRHVVPGPHFMLGLPRHAGACRLAQTLALNPVPSFQRAACSNLGLGRGAYRWRLASWQGFAASRSINATLALASRRGSAAACGPSQGLRLGLGSLGSRRCRENGGALFLLVEGWYKSKHMRTVHQVLACAVRANHSLKRTRTGMPLQAFISFWALRVLPARAA